MITRDEYLGGYSIEVLGRKWHFSARALEVLEVDGTVSEATPQACVIELGRQVKKLDEYFEVDYHNVPLKGMTAGGVIIVDYGENQPR